MSNNREEVLRQFSDVTGADETRSRFFLESSNWQLEVALSSFFEHGGNIEEPPSVPRPTPMALSSDSEEDSLPDSPVNKKKEKKKNTNTNKMFRTIDSLKHESSSEDDEGEAFYAGGSVRSGQQILGPGKGSNDIVSQMFKSVRERGAVVFEDEPSTTDKGRGAFSGVGYRLGQTNDDHEKVTPTNSNSESGARAVRLRLYRDGFTVDDGALRPYADPANKDFLDSIRRGEVPSELAGGGREVRVSLEDRRRDAAPSAPRSALAFAGAGHMLGSPAPATVGATAPVAAAAADREADRRAAQLQLAVEDVKPTTTVQVRLADGSRLTGRFNHSHTVGDLRRYVTTAEPAYQLRDFVLLTAFPTRELVDLTVTLADANLLNSTVIQRLK